MTITTVPAVAQPGPCTCAIPRSLPLHRGSLHGPCAVPCGRRPGSGRRQPVPRAYLGGTSSGTRYEHTRVVTSHFRNVHPYLQRRRQGSIDANYSALSFFFFFFSPSFVTPSIASFSLFLCVALYQWLEGAPNLVADQGTDQYLKTPDEMKRA